MKISQRNFLTSTTFDFHPDRLDYTLRDLSGSRQVSVDYANISFESRRIVERQVPYFYVGLILAGVGGLFGAFVYSTEGRLSAFNYAILGVLLLVGYFVHVKTYVMLDAGSETLLVLGGRHERTILDEIDRRRKASYLEMLRRPDLESDEARRRALIQWMTERGVVSKPEADALIAEHRQRPPTSADGLIN